MTYYYFGLIVSSAILDIIANLLMQKSDGFKNKRYGIAALFFICVAFTLLSEVTEVMDLAVAYASWGAIAVLGTAVSANFLFGQKLNWLGWLGLLMVIGSIILLKTA